MKRIIAAFLSSLLLAGTLSAPVIAAKPLKGITGTVTTNSDITNIHADDIVTFTATTNADWWKHSLLCYQGDQLVMVGGWKFYSAGTASVTLTLSSPTYNQNPVGADCEVWVAVWKGYSNGYNGTVLVPEPLRFTLLP